MDRYRDTVDWLYAQLPMFSVVGAGAYKPGLDTSRMLDDAFGNAHRRFKTVHVAGTNGKGSTSHSLASILMAAGHKVGLYTSPHLVDFRERIRVDGVKITQEAVVDFVDRYRRMGLDCQPSFFELTTIMAFDYFSRQGVDYAVIEVGLGGRLDTTNIITPELSVITNVSLDHVALLGDTEAQIAREKAGIIKPGVPIVIGEAQGAVRQVFADVAAQVGAPIVFAEDTPVECEARADCMAYSLRPRQPLSVVCDLVGDCQAKNANTVIHAARLLGLPDEAIILGMASVQERTGLMGRWMTIGQAPLTVCDTGHNIGAWQYLAPRLATIAAERPTHIVLGFASDKDAEAIFKLLPAQAEYYFVAPNVKRARPADQLLRLGEANSLRGRAFPSVREGYDQARADSPADGFVFVGGSNFVVAEIL